MRLVAPLALLLVPVLVVTAHPGDEYEALSAEAGNIIFYVTPQTLVVKEQRDVVFMGEAAELRDQRYAPVLNASWTLVAVGPGAAPVEVQPYGQGFAARVNFSAPGEWTLRVSANGTSSEIPLNVYPATRVRAESPTLRYDLLYAGRETRAVLSFVDDVTGSLVRDTSDVFARVERWENGTKQTDQTIELSPGRAAGEYSFEHTFDREGAYLVRIASSTHGIGFEDLPPLKLNVLPARLAEDDVGSRESPAWGTFALIACALLVALAARRR